MWFLFARKRQSKEDNIACIYIDVMSRFELGRECGKVKRVTRVLLPNIPLLCKSEDPIRRRDIELSMTNHFQFVSFSWTLFD